MKLSAPQKTTWWIAFILGILGVLGTFVSIPVVSGLAFWFVAVGWLLLVLGTYLKGL